MIPEQSLSASLGLASTVDNPYWLHMEIKADPLRDGMTVAEAADIIDATYNIKACEPLETQQHDIWNQSGNGTNRNIWDNRSQSQLLASASENTEMSSIFQGVRAAQQRFADSLTDYTTDCKKTGATVDELITYDVTIKIFRSHRDELYKLQMANGKAGLAIKKSGLVVHTVDIKGQNSHTFDNPIIRTPVIVWQGIDGPEIHITGNTIFWDGYVDGTLRAEFYSEWDEVTITVTGDHEDREMITGTDSAWLGTGWYSGSQSGEEISDYQDVQCSVLAFYHYQYDELLLSSPERDDSVTETDKLNLCNFIATFPGSESAISTVDPDTRCQQHVSEKVVCQCGSAPDQKLASRYEVVPCPPGVRDGTTLQGSVERKTYKDCGYRDEANDPAVYEAHCCEPWPFDDAPMPLCKEIITPFRGTNEKNFKESDYPDGTKFVTVLPPAGLCGEHTVEQVLNPRQCCAGVPQIVWDYENSINIIAPNSLGKVFVTGGKPQYLWKVRGVGCAFDSTGALRDAMTIEPYITIYTNSATCGMITISVTDGCSSVAEQIKSTQGRWTRLGSFRTRDQIGKMDGIFLRPSSMYYWTTSLIILNDSGKYRLSQRPDGIDDGATYSGRAHPWAACSDRPAENYLDPVIGLFSVKGLTGGNAPVGAYSPCAPGQIYRVGYYGTPVASSTLSVNEWGC